MNVLLLAITIAIWPGSPPDAQPAAAPETTTVVANPLVAGRPWKAITSVSQPAMTVYAPKTKNIGAAVVVFPGGAYHGVAIDLEGTEVCDWIVTKGVTCVVLKYRVPNSGPESPIALEDAQRTIGLVRSHAAEWHVDKNKVGVIGFSAGGHLAANVGTHCDKRAYPPIDAADAESCRPDFEALIYPAFLPLITPTKETPPTFVVQAEDDPAVDVTKSIAYFEALKKAGVAAEMHLYAHGGHGFGIRPTHLPITHWPALAEAWLKTIGILPE
ncbi:MAG TPA: alpha/beta hydrolase [Thermoanaerobaculia bacterium]|nr:alpha/beta hydrolase [Thermoanaerobaculia bacterium]